MKKDKLISLVYLTGAALLLRGLYALPPVRKTGKSILTFLQAASAAVLVADLTFPVHNPKTPTT